MAEQAVQETVASVLLRMAADAVGRGDHVSAIRAMDHVRDLLREVAHA